MKYKVDYMKYVILYNYLKVAILNKCNISQTYYKTKIPNIDIKFLNKKLYGTCKNETVIAIKYENANKSTYDSLRIFTL